MIDVLRILLINLSFGGFMLRIKCLRSKKNTLYYVLVYVRDNVDIFVTFDVPTIARVWGKSVRDVYLLDEGDVIEI